ncbi:MAG: hypothetical protein JWL90_3362 [Chthoniobacteraceae bacterium]|nr:hypothetical protein [Chthoniobacteraceae bacterium]
MRPLVPLLLLFLFLLTPGQAEETSAPGPGVVVEQIAKRVRVTWPISAKERGEAVFDLDPEKPLIESFGIAAAGQPVKTIATGLNPMTLLTIGSRDLANPAGWVAFFDNPPLRPHETYLVMPGERRLQVIRNGTHTTVSMAEASAASFRGDVRFTFYNGSPLVQAETVLMTSEDGCAIIYDTGLTSVKPDWKSNVWKDPAGMLQRVRLDSDPAATPVAVTGRTIVAESGAGSLALFPAPHRFFYPQDEAYNLQFVWHGRNYGGERDEQGLGIRQSISGDKRYVPWFNAPPDTEQRLGVFYLLTSGDGAQALDEVARYTHGDRYKKLPGYLTFTSHYHMEHVQELLKKQKALGIDTVPPELELPPFVKTFKARGVDIAHLAEFHLFMNTPKQETADRLAMLKKLHEECARLSDNQLLVLPGEEPNVHLGGHWLSLFPKPIYWVLNRPKGKPFVQELPGYGTVYHVGNSDDVLKLMEKENGLMWTAHARIKGSIGFPDQYKERDFFRSEHFLGAAWKQMPADLSRPTLGWRVLDTLDEMMNWGLKKQALGEVDIFRVEPEFETYAHMNINYLRLDKLPRFGDGWQPVLDALRGGRFFTSTGEVLIPEFTVGGKRSGDTLDTKGDPTPLLEASLDWTFPLAFAEIVSGDGRRVYRERINLSERGSSQKISQPVDLKGRTWVRFEVWDIAANGAFTQAVWLDGEKPDAPSLIPVPPVPPVPSVPPVPPVPPQPSTGARFVPERKDDFAWENDLVAFRAYGPAIRAAGQVPKAGDEESGIDCWCKRVPYPIIDKWYADETRGLSYHQDHGEGNDLYKVGSSRGCGGTAIWKNGRMIISGPFKTWNILSLGRDQSTFELTYDYDVDGEAIHEVKRITIGLGKRLFRSESTFTKNGQPAALDIAVGVTTHEGLAKATLNREQGWMSCWETIEGNGLGTGVWIAPGRIAGMLEYQTPGTKESHALLIAHTDAAGKVTHFAGFGWEKAGEIRSPEEWHAYLAKFDPDAKPAIHIAVPGSEPSRLPLTREQLSAGFTDVIPTAAKRPVIWRWITAQPPPDWAQPDFKDDDWAEGKSSFGTAGTPGTKGTLNTLWDTKDIWIRREAQLPNELGSSLHLIVHHDNDAEVYIDGIAAWRSENVETRGYSVFAIRPEALARLKPGANITIAAHGHNGIGGQVLDVGLVNLKTTK